jgi:hypothetical protein
MPPQNYNNHVRRVPLFLGVAFVLLATIIGACVNLWKSIGDHSRLYNAALLLVAVVCLVLVQFLARTYALRAQNRAIRSEENLRHFVITGKLLDPRLTIHQVIALRFSSDEEFAGLARQAADENLAPDTIKRAVKNWRADWHRV